MKSIFISKPADDYLDSLFRKAAKRYRPQFIQDDWTNMNKRLNQMENDNTLTREIIADKFIELANEFTNSASKEQVSAAIMFAAARYNAFEANSKSENLRSDKGDALEWYSREYRRMLDANIDEIIDIHS